MSTEVDDRVFSYSCGKFHIECYQSFLETMSIKNRRHFFHVLSLKQKEEDKKFYRGAEDEQ